MLSRELLQFCLCIVFATLVWFGYALNTQRTATVEIPILYTGVPGDVVMDMPLPETMEVVICDAGMRLSQYKKFEPMLFDLTNQISSESGEVQIPSDVLRQRIQDYLLATTTLQSIYPDNLHASYHHQHTKRVPIEFVGHLLPAAQYQLNGAIHIQPEYVHIYGSAEDLRHIDTIYTEATELVEVRDSVSQQIPLVLPHGVRANHSSVKLQAALELFTEKTIVVPLDAVCTHPDKRLILFVSEVTVTVRVGMSHFDEVGEDHVYAYCEWEDGDSDIHQLPVQLSIRDEHISSVRVSPTWVDFEIEGL